MKRRKFISGTMKAAAGTVILPSVIPSSVLGKIPPNDKINIGWIGTGRQGRGDIMETMRFDSAMVVAVSDVDSNRMALGKKMVEDFYAKKTGQSGYVDVKSHADYHTLLADKSIDAVMIKKPDP